MSEDVALHFDAAVFDLDGVLTRTARLHTAAWKEMIDAYLETRNRRSGEQQPPFDPDEEYRRYVDGKPRYEGLASFFSARGIDLPRGEPDEPPGEETICGLGNRKQEIYRRKLDEEGVETIAPMVELARELRRRGAAIGFATSSRNGRRVIDAAGIGDDADAVVDGVDLAELGLAGKPEPDLFIEAARRLDVVPDRCVLFEDARVGVEAGRRGGFGLTIGVAGPDDLHAPLLSAGAELVVDREAPLSTDDLDAWFVRRADRRPSALAALADRGERGALGRALAAHRPILFLDYDGTLTPIVERPEDAVLPEGMGAVLERVAARHPIAVVSGRGRPDVEERVGLEGIYYAGSHGFDIAGPEGTDVTYEAAEEAIPVIEEVTRRLREELSGIGGAQIEPKRFTVAVHYRRVAAENVPRVEEIVDRHVAAHPGLRKGGGKKVWEIRPDIDWDKGRAVEWILRVIDRDEGFAESEVIPVYIGDDETDEDAFRALADHDPPGVGILVTRTPQPTAAGFFLLDPGEVRELLDRLAER